MSAAKKAPYGKHGSFVPHAELAGILPGMPRLGVIDLIPSVHSVSCYVVQAESCASRSFC